MSIHLWCPSSPEKKGSWLVHHPFPTLPPEKNPVCSAPTSAGDQIGGLALTEGSPFNWCEASNPATPTGRMYVCAPLLLQRIPVALKVASKKAGVFMGGIGNGGISSRHQMS